MTQILEQIDDPKLAFETHLDAFAETLACESFESAGPLLDRFPDQRDRILALIEAAQGTGLPGHPIDQAPASHVGGGLFPCKIDEFHVVKEIASGGMGSVYEAFHPDFPARKLAIKTIRPDLQHPKFFKRFREEQDCLAAVAHPHVVELQETGVFLGKPYMVMDHVDGSSLIRHQRRHSLSLKTSIDLLLQICDAVASVHDQGIVHRDLKPANILVGRRDGRIVATLIDFGLAKRVDEVLSGASGDPWPGQCLGTLHYMAPEQAASSDGRVDARSDVFSLGVILFELLTGATPLGQGLKDSMSMSTRLSLVRNQQHVKRLERETRVVHKEALKICIGALANCPDDRYADVNSFARDLIEFRSTL